MSFIYIPPPNCCEKEEPVEEAGIFTEEFTDE